MLVAGTIALRVLVAGTLELLGERNWWLPSWLERITPCLNVQQAPHPNPELYRTGLPGVELLLSSAVHRPAVDVVRILTCCHESPFPSLAEDLGSGADLGGGRMESHSLLPYMDADNHLWEPDDAFTRHIEMRYEPYTVRVVRDVEGRGKVFFGERPAQLQSTSVIGPNGAPPPPGFFAGLRTGDLADPERFTLAAFHKAQAGYGTSVAGVDRDAHLASMDAFGVRASLVFPSMSIEYELRVHQPPEVVDGVLRAFNRWLEEDWGFAHQGRLFAVPLISMTEPVLAVRELDRVLAAGARAIQILPGKRANGKSPADLDLDAFWGRVNESGTLVCFHIGDSGAQDLFQFDLAETGQRNTGFNRSALQWYVHGDRPIMDTIAMLIMGNLFGRFPHVKVASIENGSGWLEYLLKRLDMAADAGRGGPWSGGRLSATPSEIFREHALVSPYMVEDLHALVDLVGAKSVMYGSDFPHPEDSQPPPAFLRALDGLDTTEVHAIMHDNLAAFLQLR